MKKLILTILFAIPCFAFSDDYTECFKSLRPQYAVIQGNLYKVDGQRTKYTTGHILSVINNVILVIDEAGSVCAVKLAVASTKADGEPVSGVLYRIGNYSYPTAGGAISTVPLCIDATMKYNEYVRFRMAGSLYCPPPNAYKGTTPKYQTVVESIGFRRRVK
jgi:hypothetical protein